MTKSTSQAQMKGTKPFTDKERIDDLYRHLAALSRKVDRKIAEIKGKKK